MSPNAMQSGTSDYAQAYAQYYQNGQDPYAAYGGYEAYTKMYYEYLAQQQAAAPQQAQTGEQPPPPPAENVAPPVSP